MDVRELIDLSMMTYSRVRPSPASQTNTHAYVRTCVRRCAMRPMRFSCCAIFCSATSARFLITAIRLKRISDEAYLFRVVACMCVEVWLGGWV